MSKHTFRCGECLHSSKNHIFDINTGDNTGKYDPNNPFMWTCRICKSDKYHEVCEQ